MASAAILFSEFPVLGHTPCCGCGADATYQIWWRSAFPFRNYSFFCFPLKCMGKGVFDHFWGEKNFGKFLTPQRQLLGPNRFFWRITRQNRFSGLDCSLIDEPKNKKTKKTKKKCHRRMNMLGMRRGKTPRPIFLKFGAHKFGRDVITSANFG